MAMLSSKLRSAEGGRILFWCPGCDGAHQVSVGTGDGPRWVVTYNGPDAGVDGAPPAVCHSFITAGRIMFLDDCTHALAGKTVDLPDWEAA